MKLELDKVKDKKISFTELESIMLQILILSMASKKLACGLFLSSGISTIPPFSL